jgi:hypothetical protein
VTWAASSARRRASRACSAFWRAVLPTCSIDAAVCCSALACSSVRWLRSCVPWAISDEALATPSASRRTAVTVRLRLSRICTSAAIRLVWSPARRAMRVSSPPAATAWARAAASAGSAPSWRIRPRLSAQPRPAAVATPASTTASVVASKVSKRALALAYSCAATSICSCTSFSLPFDSAFVWRDTAPFISALAPPQSPACSAAVSGSTPSRR